AAEQAQEAIVGMMDNNRIVQELIGSEAELGEIRQEAREILAQTGNPELQPEAIEQEVQNITGQAAREIATNPGETAATIDRMVSQLVTLADDKVQAIDENEIANVIVSRT